MYNIQQLKNRINKTKSELTNLATETNNINNEEVVNKSQELDELIVSFMKNELLT
ncbi:Spo0E family sporulation regulatory protein-aspartic acid phosphatase [Selenihalanaerobacter shriftii]|uniref:Spo0E like sporulation regulatory protein n=1 Tax=Selenihalanaerobacter shriftii TaxID=142842 RepID=A0A1T4JKP4_9FIRM|nr:Spo0E family sporulation regulatory protein-aspartic acid phosphatase [Selenihalanaerobacter shriftii]SJZ30726.1 Spo0E like sporulation regulatory protein [Selenihalanaerobacter shriftii]